MKGQLIFFLNSERQIFMSYGGRHVGAEISAKCIKSNFDARMLTSKNWKDCCKSLVEKFPSLICWCLEFSLGYRWQRSAWRGSVILSETLFLTLSFFGRFFMFLFSFSTLTRKILLKASENWTNAQAPIFYSLESSYHINYDMITFGWESRRSDDILIKML